MPCPKVEFADGESPLLERVVPGGEVLEMRRSRRETDTMDTLSTRAGTSCDS